MRRVFHRVQVIQVAEELVEAVDGGQELIPVAQMVLAELAGGVALALSAVAIVQASRRDADLGARLADRGHAGADGQLAHDEVRPTRRAAGLGVVVGEQHALLGHLVEVRRPPGHHAAVVGADVPHADVVAHDDEDVGLSTRDRLILRCGRVGEGQELPFGGALAQHVPAAAFKEATGTAAHTGGFIGAGGDQGRGSSDCFFDYACRRRPGVDIAEYAEPTGCGRVAD